MKYNFLILVTFFSLQSFSQDKTINNESNVSYYGRDHFLIEGTAVADSLKESPYDRLPVSYKDKVRQPVWDLSKSSAGITVRFHSNSTSINLKWTVLNDLDMSHMAATGIKGMHCFNLVAREQWLGFEGRPETGMFNYSGIVQNFGVGAVIVYDKIGLEQNVDLKINGSYHVNVGDKGKLGLGLDLGFLQKFVNKVLTSV